MRCEFIVGLSLLSIALLVPDAGAQHHEQERSLKGIRSVQVIVEVAGFPVFETAGTKRDIEILLRQSGIHVDENSAYMLVAKGGAMSHSDLPQLYANYTEVRLDQMVSLGEGEVVWATTWSTGWRLGMVHRDKIGEFAREALTDSAKDFANDWLAVNK